MLALIPLFPLIGFVINAALGRRLSKAVSGAIASAVMVASLAVSVMSGMTLVGLPASERVMEQTVYTWIASGDFVVDLTLRLVRGISPQLASLTARYLIVDPRPSQSAYALTDHLVHSDPIVERFESWASGVQKNGSTS